MRPAVCLLVVALALVAIALAVQLARSERELRSIARFLAERDPGQQRARHRRNAHGGGSCSWDRP